MSWEEVISTWVVKQFLGDQFSSILWLVICQRRQLEVQAVRGRVKLAFKLVSFLEALRDGYGECCTGVATEEHLESGHGSWGLKESLWDQ